MPDGWKPIASDWRDEIQAGDILYEGGNPDKPRVVRAATYGSSGRLHSVTFAILRCSWTGRPYTVVCRPDLKTRGFQPSGLRRSEMTLMDKRLNAAIEASGRGGARTSLTCCHVHGIR